MTTGQGFRRSNLLLETGHMHNIGWLFEALFTSLIGGLAFTCAIIAGVLCGLLVGWGGILGVLIGYTSLLFVSFFGAWCFGNIMAPLTVLKWLFESLFSSLMFGEWFGCLLVIGIVLGFLRGVGAAMLAVVAYFAMLAISLLGTWCLGNVPRKY